MYSTLIFFYPSSIFCMNFFNALFFPRYGFYYENIEWYGWYALNYSHLQYITTNTVQCVQVTIFLTNCLRTLYVFDKLKFTQPTYYGQSWWINSPLFLISLYLTPMPWSNIVCVHYMVDISHIENENMVQQEKYQS